MYIASLRGGVCRTVLTSYYGKLWEKTKKYDTALLKQAFISRCFYPMKILIHPQSKLQMKDITLWSKKCLHTILKTLERRSILNSGKSTTWNVQLVYVSMLQASYHSWSSLLISIVLKKSCLFQLTCKSLPDMPKSESAVARLVW